MPHEINLEVYYRLSGTHNQSQEKSSVETQAGGAIKSQMQKATALITLLSFIRPGHHICVFQKLQLS